LSWTTPIFIPQGDLAIGILFTGQKSICKKRKTDRKALVGEVLLS